jgi:hypothetical protein
MDVLQFIIELIKITLPAVIVAAAMYLLVRQYLHRDHQRKLLELRIKNTDTVLPIRLQAYERITLFLERITPSNLLVRVGTPGVTAQEFHRMLLTEIRNEYNHNLSQQLYMSEPAWTYVKRAREDVVTLINKAHQQVGDKGRGTDMAKRILETIIAQEIDPTAKAINFIKREISQVW